MKIYVVSYKSNNKSWENGVYCVCDTLDKATAAILAYINQWDDALICSENEHDIIVEYFTHKGKWRIERLTLNETGL